MLDRNFIVKTAENFSENNAKKLRLKIPFHNQEIVQKTKIFHSVMRSMTMFSPNQNLSNFVLSQTSKPKPA